MKEFISKYHLKSGVIVAVIFPGIFIFSDNNLSFIFTRFISSFVIIISMWLVNFTLIDFTSSHHRQTRTKVQARWVRFVISFILSVLIYVLISLTIDRSGSLLSQINGGRSTHLKDWLYLSLRIMLFNALIIVIKYLYDSQMEKRKAAIEIEELKRENLNALHNALKQQVSPHFLFNSLNTLKALTRRDAVQARHFIDELSLVYRYMLLHHDKNEVSVWEEINFLKSYLFLLKIRFGDALQTQIQIPDEILQCTMPPNTLQLLIENVVKHNTISFKKPLSISIFTEEGYLAVENNLQLKSEPQPSSQFGLRNISSRYLLLKNSNIIIQKNEEKFRVLLPVN